MTINRPSGVARVLCAPPRGARGWGLSSQGLWALRPPKCRHGVPHPAHLGLLGQGLGRKATWSQVMPRLRTNLMNFPLKFVQLFHRSCEQER